MNELTKQHKIHIFIRGTYYQFFLDVPLEECHKREERRIAELSDLQREQELKHELHTIEIDFDDFFYMWINAGQDINEFAKMCIQRID
jgi:hypothetical protein